MGKYLDIVVKKAVLSTFDKQFGTGKNNDKIKSQ